MLLKMKIINVQSTTLVKVDRNTAKDQLLQDRGKSLSANSSVIVSTSAFMITKSKWEEKKTNKNTLFAFNKQRLSRESRCNTE